MLFKDIAGHKKIKEKLIYTIKNKRVSHALLFDGPEGNGKLALAIAYAQYLSCTNKKENDSCGECPSCKKYRKLIHPDLHFVYPVVKTKKTTKPVSDDYIKEWRTFILERPYHAFNPWLEHIGVENQQAGIFAQESSEIIRKLNFKTFEAEYKVMIVWMPEKMNTAASNKLLKMIEEPPPKTLFILVSENRERIIKTILSRTQTIKIPKIDNQSIFDKIKEKYNFDNEKINEIVRIANGSCLKAEKAIKSEGEENISENFKNFTDLMRLSYSVEVSGLIKWSEQISKLGRERQKEFINYSLLMLRENFIMNIAPEVKNNIVYLSGKEKQFSDKFCKFIHQNNINHLNNEFNKASRHIERNGYDKLIFLDLALKTAKLLKIKQQ